MSGFDIGGFSNISWSDLFLTLAMIIGVWLATLPLFTILVPFFFVIVGPLLALENWIDQKSMAQHDTSESFGGIQVLQDAADEYERLAGRSWW